MSDSRDPKMNEAAEDVRELQESAAASFFALEDSLPDDPAAVSAPAGEATPHDPTYFTDALFEAAKILGNTHGLDTKLMGAAHLLRHYAELARSPAPASGAPGEEDDRLIRALIGAVSREAKIRPAEFHAADDALRTHIASLRTRLAASERAAEAMREALGAWDAEAGVLAFTNVLIAARKCAALTPTAPSPDRED